MDFGLVTFPHMSFQFAGTRSTPFVESLPPSLDYKHMEGRDYVGFVLFFIIHCVLADKGECNREKGMGVAIFSHSQSRSLESCREKSG